MDADVASWKGKVEAALSAKELSETNNEDDKVQGKKATEWESLVRQQKRFLETVAVKKNDF